MFTNEPPGQTKFELIGDGQVRITPEGQLNAVIVIPLYDLIKFALELPSEAIAGAKFHPLIDTVGEFLAVQRVILNTPNWHDV